MPIITTHADFNRMRFVTFIDERSRLMNTIAFKAISIFRRDHVDERCRNLRHIFFLENVDADGCRYDIAGANWSDVTWQIAEVDSRGRLIRLGSHPFAIATLIGLVSGLLYGLCRRSLAVSSPATRSSAKNDNDEMSDAPREGWAGAGRRSLCLVNTAEAASRLQRLSLRSARKGQQEPSDVDVARSDSRRRAACSSARTPKSGAKSRISTRACSNPRRRSRNCRASLSESQRLGMLDAVTFLKNRHWLEAEFAEGSQSRIGIQGAALPDHG